MLRRRKKPGGAREDRRGHAAAPAPASAPVAQRSRRRMRPGAVVPPELQLPDSKARELKQTPKVVVPAKAGTQGKDVAPPKALAQPRQGTGLPASAGKTKNLILVTGFEPFGGESLNPSWEICERLPREIGGLRVETCLVPCAFRRAIEAVADAIERHRPSLVVSIGQAGGRAHLSVERVAINVDDARIADNAGAQPVDERVAPDGPAAHFATLPVKAMVAAMRAAGVPAEVSNTAGTFVCNHLMYGVLHFIEARGFPTRAGFIHVPYAEDQVLDKPGTPAMALDSMVRGVAAAIEAAARTRVDLKVSDGALN